MKHLVLATTLAAAAALSPPVRAQSNEFEAYRVGQFKGYEYVSRFLFERLLDPQDGRNRSFELAPYFGEPFVIAGGLSSLLGSYSGQGTSNDFRNGIPNGVNMLLWHLGFVAFGQAVGQVCDDMDGEIHPSIQSATVIQLAPMLTTALQAICSAGNNSTMQAAALEQVWIAVFAYDLPQREMQAFVAFYTADTTYMGASGHEQIAMAINGMLLNPLFLLSR